MTTQVLVTDGPSLRRRALLAVALTAGFYTLAITIAGAMIAVAVVPYLTGRWMNIWLAIALLGAALSILWALVPERVRWEAPGPELRRNEHPALHDLLDEVSSRAAIRAPDRVYADLQLNASVLEHRRERVLVLGLPLLAVLSRPELRAVVGHELGHFAGGDTRFSGWIWRTRVAVLKTVDRLASSDSAFRSGVVRLPFEWYAKLFLRLTEAVSREQEFAADRVAAAVAGSGPAGTGLRRLAAATPAYDTFWEQDVVPALAAERRPSMSSGFRAMVEHTDLAGPLDEVVAADLQHEEAGAYASHPTLRQRLEALGEPVDAVAPPPTDDPALGLLRDVEDLERRVLGGQFGQEVEAFEPLEWDDAGAVHLTGMQRLLDAFGAAVPKGTTLAGAADLLTDLRAFRGRLRGYLEPHEYDAGDAELNRLALDVLVAAVCRTLVDAGARLSALPGEPLKLTVGTAPLDPWNLLGAIAEGKAPAAEWATAVTELELADTVLATGG